jgi:protein SCO1
VIRSIASASLGASMASVVGVVVLGFALAACGAGATPFPSFVMAQAVTQPPFGVRDTAYEPPLPAPPLRLTDQDGRPFDLSALTGAPVFVYFGYTHCPDICPTTLADLRMAIATAGVPARVVFVTIDPARDTAAAMRQYTAFYDAGFIGLTGSPDDIASAAAAWGVTYRQMAVDANGNYAMTHSTDTYLVDGSGLLRNHIFFGAPVDLVVDLLRTAAG